MSNTGERSNGFAMAIVVEGGLGLVALVLAWIFGVSLREQLADPGVPLAWAVVRGVAVTLPMLAVFWWLVHSSRPALRRLREQVEWLLGEMFPSAGIAQLALVAALAGVGEELLFRGFLQNLIGRWTTPIVGLVVASLLFGFAHALSKLYFAFATLIGLCFGWLTFEYNDLVAPMVAHGLYDFVALAYLTRGIAKRNLRQPLDDSTAEAEGNDGE